MAARSLPLTLAAITVFVLTLLTGSPPVSAQETKSGPLPPGVMACDVRALTNDSTREGLNIRAEPRADATILGRLPIIENVHGEKIAPDVHIIGAKAGWFLIEGAAYGDYDLPPKRPPLYAGRGWVSGKLLTTTLQTRSLRAAPEKSAAEVVEGDWFEPSAFLDCKGDWLRVEVPLSTKEVTLKPKLPSDGPKGTVRGWAWARMSCTNQRTTCDFGGVEPPQAPNPEMWLEDAKTKCIEMADEQNTDCKVEQWGELGTVYVSPLYHARYRYADPKDHALDYERVVILEGTGGGHVQKLFATPGDPAFHYETPQILKLADRTLLWIPGHESGTGNLNREQVFVWRDYDWRKGDAASWLGDLAARLPPGLTVQKGVYPDYATMTAETPVWRQGDPDACPTGGRAKIVLGWHEDRVIVRGVRVAQAGECGEPKP